MRNLIILCLLLSSCSPNKPKFHVGDCLVGPDRLYKVSEVGKYSYKLTDGVHTNVVYEFSREWSFTLVDCYDNFKDLK